MTRSGAPTFVMISGQTGQDFFESSAVDRMRIGYGDH